MGIGIIVCGLNGSGKSTLGKALSDKLGFHFIDNENLFFPKNDSYYIYASPRSREEAVKLLMNEVRTHENFVLAAVKGDYGNEILPFYKYVILIDVPKDIRLNRVRIRSFQKFGNRMLPGGDLREREEAFFCMISSRTEDYVEEWVQSINCKIIRIDGTRPIDENIRLIIEQMQG